MRKGIKAHNVGFLAENWDKLNEAPIRPSDQERRIASMNSEPEVEEFAQETPSQIDSELATKIYKALKRHEGFGPAFTEAFKDPYMFLMFLKFRGV